MSLVTRCPACSTMFKVVVDQLRVSQGWVRCGNCSDVFDANAYLQSVFHPAVEEEWQQAAYAQDDAARLPITERGAPNLDSINRTEKSVEISVARTVTDQLNQTALPKNENATVDVDVDVDQQLAVKTLSVQAGDIVAPVLEPHLRDDGVAPPNFQNVSFVRKARREAFWQQSFIRFGLVFLAGICVMLLGVQWAVQHKDQVIAAKPRSLPVLQALCKPFRCRIKPLQRIESLLIDSVSLVKLDGNSFRFSFVLKNTADAPLEVPLLELTLTDIYDKAVSRRVVLPVEFGARSGELLAAHSDTGGVINLTVAPDERAERPITAAIVSGYRVLIFYP